MDIQTRHSGSFARAGSRNLSWLEQNRALAIRLSVVVVFIVLVVLAFSLWSSNQASKAKALFNQAMEIYDSPLKQPGEPPMPDTKTYSSAAARGRAANPIFTEAAEKYSSTEAGKNARYFAGLTAEDMGDRTSAEADLNKASNVGDKGLEALAKMALASLYVQTGRSSQAATLYRELIAHPTLTVSADAARLALASSEETTNPQDARVLYAKVKDNDKTGAAGEIASEKLNGGH